VERGICPIATSTMNEPVIMAGCMAHARNGCISTSGLKSNVTIVFLDPRFPTRRGNFDDSRTFKADIGLLNICMGFQDFLAWNGDFGGQNRGRDGAISSPNELVLPFGGSYVCANFGENRSRNATPRVLANGQTHRRKLIFTALHAMQRGKNV